MHGQRNIKLSDERTLQQGIVNYVYLCSDLVALRYQCVQVVLLSYILILQCISLRGVNYMQRSPSWRANSLVASREINHLLRNPYFHYHV
jgi:hypothetical protein